MHYVNLQKKDIALSKRRILIMEVGVKKVGTTEKPYNDLRIVWKTGEFESLKAFLPGFKDYEDLEKLGPEDATNLLKLLALREMGESAYTMLKPEETFSFKGKSILNGDEEDGPDEEDIFLSVFGGTSSREKCLIAWHLLNAISKGLSTKKVSTF
jgi:hypothetical protein